MLVTNKRTVELTIVSVSVTFLNESRSRKGHRPATPAGGASAVPAGGGLVTLAPGRFRHHPAGTMTGARGASLDWDRHGAGNARGAAQGLRPPVGAAVEDRTLRPSPRKHGLTLSLRDEQSLRREPRWNAERRAAPAGAAPHRKVRWLDVCAFRRSASFFFFRRVGRAKRNPPEPADLLVGYAAPKSDVSTLRFGRG